jgi:hypothetical protein
VGEPINGEGVANAEGAWDVTFVAPVMLGGGANVPAIHSMGCHVVALFWCDVDNNSGARWRKRAAVEIEDAIEAVVG